MRGKVFLELIHCDPLTLIWWGFRVLWQDKYLSQAIAFCGLATSRHVLGSGRG